MADWIVAHLVYGASVALASDADLHKAVRPQLMVIEARGKPEGAAAPTDSFRMGFTISDDGFVITTYTLLSKLGDVKPESITVRAAPATTEHAPDTGFAGCDLLRRPGTQPPVTSC